MAIKQDSGPTVTNTNALLLKRQNLLFLLGAIVLVTCISFLGSTKNGFTNWDDNAYVFENPHLAKSMPDAIRYFFGPNYFIGNYIPLTMLVYSLEYHAAGLDAEFFHVTQLIIHLLNVLLVFWFIFLLSKKKPLVAAVVALLFGIHPMHVESVAWIAELKDVMYTFFFMAGLIAYQKYLDNLKEQATPGKKQKPLLLWGVVFVLFVLSGLSKPAALIFPLVLLLLDYYSHRELNLRAWLEKVPFFMVSFGLGYVAILAQKADNLLHTDYSWAQRFLFASHSFVAYLWKLVLPMGLSNFYPYPSVAEPLPVLYYVMPLVVLLLMFGVYKTLKHTRLYVFGFLFFAITILSVLQFVSFGDAIMADRYTYVPYIGLFYILAMLFDRFYQGTRQKALLLAVLFVLVFIVSGLTRARSRVWKDDDSLATNLLARYPDDWLALNNKGFVLSGQGRFEEAIGLYKKALEIKPDYTRASINLINSLVSLRYTQTALKAVDSALVHTPANSNLLNAKAQILMGAGNNAEAIKVYKQLLLLQDNKADALINLSLCFFGLKDYTQALRVLDAGLFLYPSNYVLLNNKGYLLFSLKRYSEAIPYFKSSLALKLDYSTAQINLDDCYKALADSVQVKQGQNKAQ